MPDIIAPSPELQPGMREGMGRLKLFDERSLDHSIRRSRLGFWRSLSARVRTRVNHRAWFQGNQGNTSQCTAYGVLHAWEAGRGHARGTGRPLAGRPRPLVSPRTVYVRSQELDQWDGSELVHPFYKGSSGTAAAKALHEMGLITGYDWEFDDIEVCERAIFTDPLGFGLDWHAGMMLDGAPKVNWSNAIIRPDGPVIGGHFVCAVGFDKKRNGAEWEILNSWGKAWGYGGRCFISRDDLGLLLSRDGECVMLNEAADADIATRFP